MTRLHIDDDQRRARLARRHALHPDHRAPDLESATRSVGVLHSTEAASVHLSLAARSDHATVEGIDHALYGSRTLVKQLAMRRTLFVFPRDLLPYAWASASDRVAGAELRRLAQDVERAAVATEGLAWIEAAIDQVEARLASGEELSIAQLRDELPALAERVLFGSGKWAQESPVAQRLVTIAGARGRVVRGHNDGHWRVSKPTWTSMSAWLGDEPPRPSAAEGYAELVRRWLWSFGPGTEADLVWWLGATKSAVRAALDDLEVVEVSLDDGSTGYVLPDDTDPVPAVGDWAALLPTLDPTTMGWKQRGFHLDPADVPFLFDTNGNAGTTAWWNGRIVGCWVQDDARVRVVPRAPLPRAAIRALDHEAERLTAWLDGVTISSVYASPQQRGERLP